METGLVQKNVPVGWKQFGFCEYLLVAQPDGDVYNKVMEEKQAFYEEFAHIPAIKTQPHVTIANFVAKEAMEETITRYIQRICNQQPAFDVMLNNYSGFPPHTIYIRVQDRQPFRLLARELKAVGNYIQSCNCPPVKLITNPHVAIALSLPEEVYFKALMQYSQKIFHEIFTVNQLVLLRRINQYHNYNLLNIFQLNSVTNLFN